MSTAPAYFEIVQTMESQVSTGQWDNLDQFFSSDLTYIVGHLAPKAGVNGLRQHMNWQSQLVTWKGHDTHLVTVKDNALIVEVTSFFHRHEDATDIHLPCMDIYRFNDNNKIFDWRVYADITPFKVKW